MKQFDIEKLKSTYPGRLEQLDRDFSNVGIDLTKDEKEYFLIIWTCIHEIAMSLYDRNVKKPDDAKNPYGDDSYITLGGSDYYWTQWQRMTMAIISSPYNYINQIMKELKQPLIIKEPKPKRRLKDLFKRV